jgi:apolipoprotein N-acyltransferase
MQPGLFLRVLASSILLILSFPRPDVGLLSLFALVPLFTGLSDTGKLKAFLVGWGTGIVWFFVSYNWISHSITTFGNIPLPLAEGVICLLAGIHGLYVGLFSILIPLVAREGKIDSSGAWERGPVAADGIGNVENTLFETSI